MSISRRGFVRTTTSAAMALPFARLEFRQQAQPAINPTFTDIRRNVGHFTARGGTIGWLANKDAAEAKPAATPSSPSNKEDRKAAAQARQQRVEDLKPLRKELNKVDNRLGVLFTERDKLEAVLSDGATPPKDLAEAGRKLKAVGDEIAELEGRWLELSTEIEGLEGGR